MPKHEEAQNLTKQTLNSERASQSLREEIEAVELYQQRIDATDDEELKNILAHNRDEEKEHAAMLIEYLRRQDSVWDKELKDYLFKEGSIGHN